MQYTQKDSKTGVLKFYGHISVWWNSADDFTRTFDEMQSKFKVIEIRLHCYGGDVLEGTVIYNAIANSKSDVYVYIDGVAASMGGIIPLPAKKIVMAENAFWMIHSPSGYTDGPAEAHFTTGNLLKSMEKNFAKAYARKTGKKESEAQKWFDGNDHWFSAEEAKEAGLVDEISEPIAKDVANAGKPDKPDQEASLYNRYAAQLAAPPPPEKVVTPVNTVATVTATTTATANNNYTAMKQDLIKKFSLEGVDANSSETAIIEAIAAKFGSVEAALKTLQDDKKKQETVQINALIDIAQTASGKVFTAEDRANLVATGEKVGIKALQTMLGITAAAGTSTVPTAATGTTQAAAPQIVNLIKTAAGGGVITAEDRSAWTWDTYQEKASAELEDMPKTDPAKFISLFKAKYGKEPVL